MIYLHLKCAAILSEINDFEDGQCHFSVPHEIITFAQDSDFLRA